MKFGWPAFIVKSRLSAIEGALTDVRETVAVLSAQTRAMDALVERITALEEGAEVNRATLRKSANAGLVADAQVEMQGEEIVRLRNKLLRLERQLNDDAEEARRIATGLLERIELIRHRP